MFISFISDIKYSIIIFYSIVLYNFIDHVQFHSLCLLPIQLPRLHHQNLKIILKPKLGLKQNDIGTGIGNRYLCRQTGTWDRMIVVSLRLNPNPHDYARVHIDISVPRCVALPLVHRGTHRKPNPNPDPNSDIRVPRPATSSPLWNKP